MTYVVPIAQIFAHHDALNRIDMTVDSDGLRHQPSRNCNSVIDVRSVDAVNVLGDDALYTGTPRAHMTYSSPPSLKTAVGWLRIVSSTSSTCPESTNLPIDKAKPVICSSVIFGNESTFGSVIASTSTGPS